MKTLLFLALLLLSFDALTEPVKYADSSMIESATFGEPRQIMIALPDSYMNDSGSLYPVIYVVRGQSDMLGVVAAIDMLAAEVPEFVVVGISGIGHEFIPAKNGEQSKFSKLLHNEVVPHIQKNYRTAPYSILVGHSAAGKFVSNDWLDRGSDFSSYYAVSPELHDGAINSRLRSLQQRSVSLKSPLLISMGNEDKRMRSMFDELESLSSSNTSLNSKVNFIRFEDHTHMSGRVNTVMAGLRNSFNNWRPSRKIESGKFEKLQAHYLKLGERYGYEVAIPLDTMTRQSAFHSASDSAERWQIASDIVKYSITKTPNSVNDFFDIAEEMVGYGMQDGSKRLISFICEHSTDDSRCSNQKSH